MAFEKPLFTHSFRASTGLKQYQFVNVNASTNTRLIDPTTEGNVIGVITSSGTTGTTGRAGSTDSGAVCTVQMGGIAKVIAGTTTIDAGDLIKAATDGLASTSTGPTSTSYIAGIALEAVGSTSTGAQAISVLLNYPQFGSLGRV